jgi:hypothetical protein
MAKNLTDLLNKQHYHEALDRTRIFYENMNIHLLQHPVCKLDKEIGAKIELVLDTLYDTCTVLESRNKN